MRSFDLFLRGLIFLCLFMAGQFNVRGQEAGPATGQVPGSPPAAQAGAKGKGQSQRVEVAAIYFPGYHQDPHYDAWFGEGWNEWKLLMEAQPRFPQQHFFRPAWGPFDEAAPRQMERQIDLAADHGIDVFVFDWYWYSGVKILYRPLEEGFLQATNQARLKFALMWANHDWRTLFPAPADNKQTIYLPTRTSPADFRHLMAYCMTNYFRQPNYWRVDGGLYFSIFDVGAFMQQLGGAAATHKVFEDARRQAAQAGVGRMHFAAFGGDASSLAAFKEAGFDSVTTYNITASSKASLPDHPLDEYADVVEDHQAFWKQMDTGTLPYASVVTVGWDPSPRWARDISFPPANLGYPYTTVVVHNTPERFGDLCRRARQFCERARLRPPGIFVNAWNEWTEGSALLPDQEFKTGFLDQLKQALK
jgi:hypothetical protein